MPLAASLGRGEHVAGDDIPVSARARRRRPASAGCAPRRRADRAPRRARDGHARQPPRAAPARLATCSSGPPRPLSVESAEVVLEDPFGLERVEIALPRRRVAARLPAARRRSTRSSRTRARGHPTAAGSSCAGPTGFDLHSVRDYEQGESLRRVHWPTTARRGHLMVKELEDAPRDETAVLLDADAGASSARRRTRPSSSQVQAAGSILTAHASARAARVARSSTAPRAPTSASTPSTATGTARSSSLAAVEPDGHTPAAPCSPTRRARRAGARAHRRDGERVAALVDRLLQRVFASRGDARLRRPGELRRRRRRRRSSIAGQLLRLERGGRPRRGPPPRRRPRPKLGPPSWRSALALGRLARTAPPLRRSRALFTIAWRGSELGGRRRRRCLIMLALAFVAVAVASARGAGSSSLAGSLDRGRLRGRLRRAAHGRAAGRRARLLRPGARRRSETASSTSTTRRSRSAAATSRRCTALVLLAIFGFSRRRGDPDRRAAADRRRRRPRRRASAGRDPGRAGERPLRSSARCARRGARCSSCSRGRIPRAARQGVAVARRARRSPPRRLDLRRGRQGRLPELARLGSLRPAGRSGRRPLRLELELPRHHFPEKKTTVLKVKTEGPKRSLYWRATTLDDYTGDGLDRALDLEAEPHGGDRRREIDPLLPQAARDRDELGQAGGDRRGARGQPPRRLGAAGALGAAGLGHRPLPERGHRRLPRRSLSPRPALHGLELRAAADARSSSARPARTTPVDRAYLEVIRDGRGAEFGTPDRDLLMQVFFEASSPTTRSCADHPISTSRARQVVGGAHVPVRGRVALEAWFRRPQGGFVYDEQPPCRRAARRRSSRSSTRRSAATASTSRARWRSCSATSGSRPRRGRLHERELRRRRERVDGHRPQRARLGRGLLPGLRLAAVRPDAGPRDARRALLVRVLAGDFDVPRGGRARRASREDDPRGRREQLDRGRRHRRREPGRRCRGGREAVRGRGERRPSSASSSADLVAAPRWIVLAKQRRRRLRFATRDPRELGVGLPARPRGLPRRPGDRSARERDAERARGARRARFAVDADLRRRAEPRASGRRPGRRGRGPGARAGAPAPARARLRGSLGMPSASAAARPLRSLAG